jgi:hypothetical protein
MALYWKQDPVGYILLLSNEEFLSDPVRMAEAEEQASYSRTQREMLERERLMRVINDELNPP